LFDLPAEEHAENNDGDDDEDDNAAAADADPGEGTEAFLLRSGGGVSIGAPR
jgi:hypothetical protein